MRTATRVVEIRGRPIREGDHVVIWNTSANRDEDVFDDPYTASISLASPTNTSHSGTVEHFCIGANPARLEMRVMIDELLRRLPDMAPAGPVDRLRSNLLAGIKHLPVTFTPSEVTT